MGDKSTLLILFGGVSSEHEVSRVSAASVVRNADAEKYRILKVGISKSGRWFLTQATPEEMESGSWEFLKGNREACILTDHSRRMMVLDGEAMEIDVVFPVLHGRNGEDGTIQGMLQLADIPFVGSGPTTSAACMDKAITKAVVQQAEACDQAQCCIAHKGCEPEEAADVIDDYYQGGYPLFVKPANAGSSVGISKVKSRQSLPEALSVAFAEDDKVLIEEAITGREIEVAVLGNSGRRDWAAPEASCIGEIFAANEFYDYTAKYDDIGSRTGIVTDLSPETELAIRETAVSIYEVMGCRGLARVDFFLEKGKSGGYDDGRLVFNEINTLPGFTKISMYPQLWNESGIKYPELIDRLIRLAMEK